MGAMSEARGSRREQKALATRRKILVEATRLFARQGYHKTTMADLAAAIGMTQGAIFHHFPTKEALLYAVVDRLSRGLRAYRACLEGAPSAERVREVVGLMVTHFKQQPEATVCLAALATEFAGTDDPVLDRIRTAYDTFVDAFAAALTHHPRVTDPRAAAVSFMGAVQGIAIQAMLRSDETTIDALARGFLDMLAPW